MLLFISLWIVLPAPNVTLLTLGVAAPELSPLLLVASIFLSALAWVGRAKRIHRAAGCLAVTAAILDALPLAGLPLAVRRFDEAINILGREGDGAVTDAGESRVIRDIEFAAPAGQPLTMDIYRPITAGRFPILVQIYGGAWQHGTPGDNAVFARYFASRGHAVFAIDYRHAPRWQWPAQIEDVSVALSWIRAHAVEYDGDMSRIALIGRSAGAQLALVAAYSDSANVAAVVSYYGPTNPSEGWRVPPRPDPLSVRSILEAYLGGRPDRVPDRYRDASPVTYASGNVPPTLLVYGTRDHVVDARFGRELHQRLRAAGATSVLLEIPWAEHAFDALPRGLSGQLALYYTERFLSWALRR